MVFASSLEAADGGMTKEVTPVGHWVAAGQPGLAMLNGITWLGSGSDIAKSCPRRPYSDQRSRLENA